MKSVRNVNIVKVSPLVSPRELCAFFPTPKSVTSHVFKSREAIKKILAGKDNRLLAIVGPCSIHDVNVALEYAERLKLLHQKYQKRLMILMRVYFEKPRTTIGWKGLIADPYLDGSADMPHGLKLARKLLLDINALGLPTATEMLDPIVPQYIADLISWAAIGARTTESQTHREMASGLSMPVGFKNSTDGNLQIPIDAMASSRHPHSFLGIDHEGRTAVVRTRGNAFVHLILRGGKSTPNYESHHIREAVTRLSAAGLPGRLIIDCSHANAGKRWQNQENVLKSILHQHSSGEKAIAGFMLESNLNEGNQPIPASLSLLRPGVSITDECIGWEKTEALLHMTCQALAH